MNNLMVIEQSNQRVLTTKQLAQVYECQEANISNNFNNNKDRFTEGKDYFLLQGASLKEFKGYHIGDESLKFVSVLYLWTERGANRHCKILDTNKSWEQFDILEENYFRVKNKIKEDVALPSNYLEALKALVCSEEEKVKLLEDNNIKQKVIEDQQEVIVIMQPKVDFADRLLKSKDNLLIREYAKVLQGEGFTLGEKKLYTWLRDNEYLMYNKEPYQRYMQYFVVIEKTISRLWGEKIVKTTKINPTGQLYFYNKLQKDGYFK